MPTLCVAFPLYRAAAAVEIGDEWFTNAVSEPEGFRAGFRRVGDDEPVPERRGGGGVAGGEQERGRHHLGTDLKSTGEEERESDAANLAEFHPFRRVNPYGAERGWGGPWGCRN